MIRTVHKWFWIWDFEKEEAWLNEMAAKGLVLQSAGFCRYNFEECVPGEYKIAIEMLENHIHGVENENYIRFLEETGAEHVGYVNRWAYFRKKTTEAFRLRSGNEAEIRYFTRIIRFMAALFLLNFYNGIYNLYLFFSRDSGINAIGIVCIAVSLLLLYGMIRLMLRRKSLKKEAEIFE